ncbi:MAG: hypothetical protein AAGF85_08105 [Bacteroidota bacterium]
MEKKLEILEIRIDELQETKFLLEQDLKRESHLRTEMQVFLGNISDSCKSLIEDEANRLDTKELVENLLKNIRDFAREYNLRI